jgi:hypothetical protein
VATLASVEYLSPLVLRRSLEQAIQQRRGEPVVLADLQTTSPSLYWTTVLFCSRFGLPMSTPPPVVIWDGMALLRRALPELYGNLCGSSGGTDGVVTRVVGITEASVMAHIRGRVAVGEFINRLPTRCAAVWRMLLDDLRERRVRTAVERFLTTRSAHSSNGRMEKTWTSFSESMYLCLRALDSAVVEERRSSLCSQGGGDGTDVGEAPVVAPAVPATTTTTSTSGFEHALRAAVGWLNVGLRDELGFGDVAPGDDALFFRSVFPGLKDP